MAANAFFEESEPAMWPAMANNRDLGASSIKGRNCLDALTVPAVHQRSTTWPVSSSIGHDCYPA